MPAKKVNSRRRKIRPSDKRLAILGGVISLVFIVGLFLWLIAFLPTFSPTWFIIGCVFLGGLAATIVYAREDRWRGAGLVFSLFGYAIFTHLATTGSRSPVGFILLTFIFAGVWIATLTMPRFVVEVWDFITRSDKLWVRLYKKIAWIVLLFGLTFIVVYYYSGYENALSGILFYGWAVIGAFFTSLTSRPRPG